MSRNFGKQSSRQYFIFLLPAANVHTQGIKPHSKTAPAKSPGASVKPLCKNTNARPPASTATELSPRQNPATHQRIPFSASNLHRSKTRITPRRYTIHEASSPMLPFIKRFDRSPAASLGYAPGTLDPISRFNPQPFSPRRRACKRGSNFAWKNIPRRGKRFLELAWSLNRAIHGGT